MWPSCNTASQYQGTAGTSYLSHRWVRGASDIFGIATRAALQPRRLELHAHATPFETIAEPQKIRRHRALQDQRQPRGRLLEGPEGNRPDPRDAAVRPTRQDRQRAPLRQSV